MTDTARSYSALQALFADNATGDISAQDLRDFLLSCMSGYGGLFLTGGVTAQALTSTPALLSNWSGNFPSRDTTPAYASSKITIPTASVVRVNFTAAFTSSAAVACSFVIRKTAAAVTGAKTTVTVVDVTESQGVALSALVSCEAGDEITVYAHAASATNLTVQEAQLTVSRLE